MSYIYSYINSGEFTDMNIYQKVSMISRTGMAKHRKFRNAELLVKDPVEFEAGSVELEVDSVDVVAFVVFVLLICVFLVYCTLYMPTPQLKVLLSTIYPISPHMVPHEFLIM